MLLSVEKKPNYEKRTPHKVFDNLTNQNFFADEINQTWCTDFTYLFLTDGSNHYNCSFLDLHDRSIVASITDIKTTSDLAISILKKALESHPKIKDALILHSNHGSHYTSKEFIDFCKSVGIKQSMSKAGYPYNNAPMERYYNTFENERINLHYYHTDEELNTANEDFAYIWYNHVRPHSYSDYKTPFHSRYAT